jgi:hypothetical protein
MTNSTDGVISNGKMALPTPGNSEMVSQGFDFIISNFCFILYKVDNVGMGSIQTSQKA